MFDGFVKTTNNQQVRDTNGKSYAVLTVAGRFRLLLAA